MRLCSLQKEDKKKISNKEKKCEAIETISSHLGNVDSLTQDYIDRYTLSCPRCGIRCVQVGGCNDVTCLCKHSFLWNGPKEGTILNDISVFTLELLTVLIVLSVPFIIIYCRINFIFKKELL